MAEPFNPYHEWLGVPALERRPNHYQLLGIPLFEDAPQVIDNAADRQMAHLRTFQSGSRAADSQRVLNEVAAARICLLKPEFKAAYDAQLRVALSHRPTGIRKAIPLDPASIAGHVRSESVSPTAAAPEVTNSLVGGDSLPSANRGSGGRRRASRGKKSGFNGPGAYTAAVLVVGLIGLATILWIRANNWQIQLVDADSAKVARKPDKHSESDPAGQRDKSPAAAPGRDEPAGRAHASRAGESQAGIVADNRPPVSPGPDPLGQAAGDPPRESPAGAAASETTAAPRPSNASAARDSEKPAPANARTRWVHPGGNFSRVDGDQWAELIPDGSTKRLMAVARLPDYVELHGDNGMTHVRLYSDRCDVSFRPFLTSASFYRGGWEPGGIPEDDSPRASSDSEGLNQPVDTSEQTPQTWRYTFDRPADGWNKPGFRDAAWKTGPGRFGSDSPTPWDTSDIWLRREFELTDLNTVPSIVRAYHDDDAEIYINGVLAAQLNQLATSYIQTEVSSAARSACRQGRNVLAVHCHNLEGSQYIDVGLVDLVPPPKSRPLKEVITLRGKPIDLLKMLDIERDVFQGHWSLQDGVLTSPAEIFARLQIPYAPPAQYSLTIVGEREAGADLAIGLVVAGKQIAVVFDGWGGTVTGIDEIDGKRADANPTTIRIDNILGNRREYKIVCNVQPGGFDVQLNDASLLSWSGAPSQLSVARCWAMPRQDQLFLATGAVHRIRAMTLVPLSTQANGPEQAAGDPTSAELAKAIQAYHAALEKAKEKLLVALDSEVKKLQANDSPTADQQVQMIEQLEAERTAFDSDSSKTPESPAMRDSVSSYRTAVSAAKAKCVPAFNKAIKAYQKKKDLDNSKRVLKELDEFRHLPPGM